MTGVYISEHTWSFYLDHYHPLIRKLNDKNKFEKRTFNRLEISSKFQIFEKVNKTVNSIEVNNTAACTSSLGCLWRDFQRWKRADSARGFQIIFPDPHVISGFASFVHLAPVTNANLNLSIFRAIQFTCSCADPAYYIRKKSKKKKNIQNKKIIRNKSKTFETRYKSLHTRLYFGSIFLFFFTKTYTHTHSQKKRTFFPFSSQCTVAYYILY